MISSRFDGEMARFSWPYKKQSPRIKSKDSSHGSPKALRSLAGGNFSIISTETLGALRDVVNAPSLERAPFVRNERIVWESFYGRQPGAA